MRKFLLSITIAFIFVGVVSAKNIELDVHYFFVPYQSFNFDDNGYDIKFTLPEPAGFDINANFYFGSPITFLNMDLDLGLNLKGGMGFSGWFNEKEDGNKKKRDIKAGIDGFIKIGPVARLNINEMHSVILAPGFQFDVGCSDYKQDLSYDIFVPKFDLELGYRCWLLHKNDFDFGLSAGTDFQWYSGCMYPDSKDNRYARETGYVRDNGTEGGFAWKLYLGICMNWGKEHR